MKQPFQRFSDLPYARTDMEQIRQFYVTLEQKAVQAQSTEELASLLHEENDYISQAFGGSDIAAIRFYLNTQDAFYRDEYTWWQEAGQEVQLMGIPFTRLLLQSPHAAGLEITYGDLLLPILNNSLLLQKPEVQELKIAEANEVREYETLISGMRFQIGGKEVGKWESGAYRNNPDRDYRKQAATEISSVLTAHKPRLEALYEQLWNNRKAQAGKLGFASPVDFFYSLRNRIGYSREDVARFYDYSRQYIAPIRNAELNKQRLRMGYDTLYSYDEGFFFTGGYELTNKDPEVTLQRTADMYRAISPETDAFFRYLTNYEYLDYKNTPNKAQIGFATILSANQSPYIFSILNGSNFDITVLTHEFGHAFQFSQLPADRLRLLGSALAEVAEIHSSSMELITMPYMHLFFGEQANKYNYAVVRRGLDMILDNALVDHFLELTYSMPEFNAAVMHEHYSTLQRESRPGIDLSTIDSTREGYGWLFNGHLFSVPFYMIDYALAQMVSFQWWFEYLENPEKAWQKYLYLCRHAGADSFTGLVESAGLISPFKEEAFQKVQAGLTKWFSQQPE